MAGGHGGRRTGSGRTPGAHVHAAKALRTEARALLAEIVGTDRDPLMVAIAIAADESKSDALRLEAALGCCKYLHPALSAAAIAHVPASPSTERIVAELTARLGRMAPAVPTIEAAGGQSIEGRKMADNCENLASLNRDIP